MMTTRADRIVEQAEDWLGRSEKSPVHGRSWSVAHDVARELIAVIKSSTPVHAKFVDPYTGEELRLDQRPLVGCPVELRSAGAGWRWHDSDGQEWDTTTGATGPIWRRVRRVAGEPAWTTDQLIAAIRTAVESVLASQKRDEEVATVLESMVRLCRRRGAPAEEPKCIGEVVDGGLLLCRECGPGHVSRCGRREGFTV